MANNMVVLAIFNDEASADIAAASLKESGITKKDAIGVLALNDKGELKTDKVGKRSMGKGVARRQVDRDPCHHPSCDPLA